MALVSKILYAWPNSVVASFPLEFLFVLQKALSRHSFWFNWIPFPYPFINQCFWWIIVLSPRLVIGDVKYLGRDRKWEIPQAGYLVNNNWGELTRTHRYDRTGGCGREKDMEMFVGDNSSNSDKKRCEATNHNTMKLSSCLPIPFPVVVLPHSVLLSRVTGCYSEFIYSSAPLNSARQI